jgi:glycerophosphoryl diester phosphodiesterase
MQRRTILLTVMTVLGAATLAQSAAVADALGRRHGRHDAEAGGWLAALLGRDRATSRPEVVLGARPAELVAQLPPGRLKQELEACSEDTVASSDFSIAHRGAPLTFPEHTKESYLAAASMGAGMLECDVTFTKDRQLVCRSSQCDLHTTTNILTVPELAAKCSKPFVPADPESGSPASALCCTSDITLSEFKTLCGKGNAVDPRAGSAAAYVAGAAGAGAACGTLLSHRESIELIDSMGLKFTPELVAPSVPMPFEGDYTQERYAEQLLRDYEAQNISPRRVFPRTSRLHDIAYWMRSSAEFGQQAVFVDARVDTPEGYALAVSGMAELAKQGVRNLAPPLFALLTLEHGRIVPSDYARAAREGGIGLFAWTLERSGSLADGGGYYYQSVAPAIRNAGDMLEVLDVLAMQVGVLGVFSDWPSAVTYYANCMAL